MAARWRWPPALRGAGATRLPAAPDMEGFPDEAARADGVADRCDLFNLTVELIENGAVGAVETFKTVTLNPAYPALHVANVLSQQSSLVELLDGGTVGSAGASEGSDSAPLAPADYLGDRDLQTGIHALEQVPAFNILCIPPDLDGGDTASEVCLAAAEYCVARRAMLILDPPAACQQPYEQHELAAITLDRFAAFTREAARNSAVYFPRIVVADPSSEDGERTLPICGFVAGIWAGTDIRRGLWKAPAGVEAVLAGIARLAGPLTDRDNATPNPLGATGLRDFARIGRVVWGARTLAGADSLADEHKYVPVRRLALHIETWALQNSGWAAFDPNGERLWARLRLQLSSFMADLWRQDAFMGTTSSEAYFVKCDATTTTPADIDAGRVNVVIGFAPMKPAEYVMVLIQQSAAQASE